MFNIVIFTIVLYKNMSSKILKKLNNIILLRDTVTIFVVIYHHMSHYLGDYVLRLDGWLPTTVKHLYSSIFFIVSGYCIVLKILLKIKS